MPPTHLPAALTGAAPKAARATLRARNCLRLSGPALYSAGQKAAASAVGIKQKQMCHMPVCLFYWISFQLRINVHALCVHVTNN